LEGLVTGHLDALCLHLVTYLHNLPLTAIALSQPIYDFA
jgi:hypothetical protein